MVRERLLVLVSLAVGMPGCSLVLDFSDKQIPVDAAIDGPFTQEECDYKEPNDTAMAPAMFAATDVGPAAICEGSDRDFYRFTVPDMTASISLRITFENRPSGDLDLRLYDATGATVIAQSRGFTNEEKIDCPAASPACPQLAAGDYIFEVFPALAGAVNRYDIALAITPMTPP